MGRTLKDRQGSERFRQVIAEVALAVDEVAKRFQWVASACVVGLAIYAVVLATDREPPFEVRHVTNTEVERGQDAVIVARVRRDIERRCDATFSRYLFAADGARYDLGPSYASYEMILAIERTTPGAMKVAFRVPDRMAPGQAIMRTVISYRCNKVHALWPIVVTTEIPFTVL